MVKDITFDLHPGEVLGVSGLMGSGRSELARIIFGLDGYARARSTSTARPFRRARRARRWIAASPSSPRTAAARG